MTGILALPAGCIADLACVSNTFRSLPIPTSFGIDSYLPNTCQEGALTCHNPVLINDGKLSFWLDKLGGKKCYMISARELLSLFGLMVLNIGLGFARFSMVAELNRVCCLKLAALLMLHLCPP